MTSTKARILSTSLELFNRQGERNVTTNHIAEALAISPGNLYYHFRNKGEIVQALFEQYEQALLSLLEAPQGPLTWKDKVYYLEGALEALWQHRFFHRDLSHYLNDNAELRARYQVFVATVLSRGEVIYRQLRASGVLALNDEQLQGLMVNTWVLMSSWASLVHGLRPEVTGDEVLEKALLRQGMYQILCLEEPFLQGDALIHLREMKDRYQSGLSTVALLMASPETLQAGEEPLQ